MNNILIVEDEILVAQELSQSIVLLGYNVVGIASSSKSALTLVEETKPNLILMDIRIKGKVDGIDTAKEIKQRYDIPIIYTTALSGEEEIQRAVRTNPSAYILKPYNKQALKAAIEIAFFHTKDKNILQGDITLDGEFSFDSIENQLLCNGVFISLTNKETQLLSLLINSANKIVTFYDIENNIWPQKDANINTIRALVSRLRTKLKYKLIETIPSVGYRITLHK